MPRTKKSLEDRVWAVRVENACRNWAQAKANWARDYHPPELKLKRGPNKTRSSFAHARRNRAVDRLIPADFNSKDVDFTPGNIPAQFDLKSNFSTKNVLEYIVIKREGKRECLLARGFTKCCAPDAYCKRKRCAKCWALEQKQVKSVEYVVREIVSGKAAKIVDPFGVDPKGKRGSGKDMDPQSRSRFKLTSSQAHYKFGSADWN